jgi:hypothetical protein
MTMRGAKIGYWSGKEVMTFMAKAKRQKRVAEKEKEHEGKCGLGCLMGQPVDVSSAQIRQVSKEAQLPIRKVRLALRGNPAGLTFEEYRKILQRAGVKGS